MSTKTTDNNEQPQQPIQNVREYFNKDIMDAMNALSIKEMVGVLKDLPNSPFWIAILKYNQQRLSLSQNALFSGDPFKDPTGMARNQGILLGISDLQNAVISLVSSKEEPQEETE